MAVALVVALLVVPVAELYVILQVARGIGVLPTLALLVVVSVLGAHLLRRQGLAAWRRVGEVLRRGELPTAEVADGFFVLLGGALLLTPGFITDAVGLALMVPPVRAALRRALARAVLARAAGGVREVRVVRVERRPGRPSGEVPPRAEGGEGGDGSPGRG